LVQAYALCHFPSIISGSADLHSYVWSVSANIHPFIHSIVTCRMRRFLAVLRSYFHSSLLYTLSCHPFPPTSLPSSLTSSCHLFLGLPLSLVYKYIYNTFWGILFYSILWTCPNQRNLFNLTVSVTRQHALWNSHNFYWETV
jgi:hypothetical protein